MNFGGHLLTGWLIGQAVGRDTAERRIVTLMAIAPDIDSAFFFLPGFLEKWHRTFGHNVFFGAAVPLLALLLVKRSARRRLLPFLYLSLWSHFLLDLIVTGWWDFRPFWPVSGWSILMSLTIPENVMKYGIQLGLLAILVAVAVVVIRNVQRSPFEIVSAGFDRFMLTFLTLPFCARCVHCNARAFYFSPTDNAPVCGRHMDFRALFKTIFNKIREPKNSSS